jgi:hypothetical protein
MSGRGKGGKGLGKGGAKRNRKFSNFILVGLSLKCSYNRGHAGIIVKMCE